MTRHSVQTSYPHPPWRPTSKQYCMAIAFLPHSFHHSASLYVYFPDISCIHFSSSLVLDLIYWREVGTTGLVFTGLVVGLASLFQLSAFTILSNLGLSIMAFTLPVRLLYKAMMLVRLSDGSHPFQWVYTGKQTTHFYTDFTLKVYNSAVYSTSWSRWWSRRNLVSVCVN